MSLDPRSEEKLLGVRPELVKVIREAATRTKFRVTEGLRTPERQKMLVAQRKSKTMASRHITGHAVDFIAIGEDGVATYDMDDMRRVADVIQAVADEQGVRIERGIDWGWDSPHIELHRKTTYHPNLIQGSDEWMATRCGMLTASEMKLILTPTLKMASNDKERSHLFELLAQRITGYVEPHYISDDMLRGMNDEAEARALYHKTWGAVADVGFITNNKFGFNIGYSPDGLVGGDGLIECKSRRQKYQVQTIVENVPGEVCVPDYMIQVQTGLLVSEREWCDLISYSGGLPMVALRVYPDPEVQDAIVAAATAFEQRVAEKLAIYREVTASKARLIPTERRIEQEMFV